MLNSFDFTFSDLTINGTPFKLIKAMATSYSGLIPCHMVGI
jgi:hypothetical protein